MSAAALSWAWKQTAGSMEAKVLLAVLAHGSDPYGICWASRAELADQTELGVDDVARHLEALEKRRLIFRFRRQERTFSVVLSDALSRAYADLLALEKDGK